MPRTRLGTSHVFNNFPVWTSQLVNFQHEVYLNIDLSDGTIASNVQASILEAEHIQTEGVLECANRIGKLDQLDLP